MEIVWLASVVAAVVVFYAHASQLKDLRDHITIVEAVQDGQLKRERAARIGERDDE